MLYMFLLDPFHKTEAAGAGAKRDREKGIGARRVAYGGKREKFFIRITRNSLKSPDSEK
jgi:hypothetical protein